MPTLITPKSRGSCRISNNQQCFQLDNIKENIQLDIADPLWGESTDSTYKWLINVEAH